MSNRNKPFVIHAGLNTYLYLEKNEVLHSLVISNYNKENQEEVDRFYAIIGKLQEDNFRVITAEELQIYPVDDDRIHIMKIDDDKNIVNTIKEMKDNNSKHEKGNYLN